MKPVVPTAKRSTGFSIDSLIGTPTTHSKTSVSNKVPSSSTGSDHPRVQTLSMGSMGLMGRVPPPHLGLPINFKTMYPDSNVNQELLALRSAWGLMGSQLETMQHLSHNPLIPNNLPINPNLLNGPRDPSLHLYPFLMARQNPCFNYPFPGVHDAGLLFHPYRKPKRIRTAFSPSQLLKLEDAFDKNHYVVGQERKDLAVKLSLTETQVKVWFQNRRTKCKRVKGEDEEDDPQSQNHSLSDKSDDEQDNSDMTTYAEDVVQPTHSSD